MPVGVGYASTRPEGHLRAFQQGVKNRTADRTLQQRIAQSAQRVHWKERLSELLIGNSQVAAHRGHRVTRKELAPHRHIYSTRIAAHTCCVAPADAPLKGEFIAKTTERIGATGRAQEGKHDQIASTACVENGVEFDSRDPARLGAVR